MIDASYQFEKKYKEVHEVRRGLIESSTIPFIPVLVEGPRKTKLLLPSFLNSSPQTFEELVRVREQVSTQLSQLQSLLEEKRHFLSSLQGETNTLLLSRSLEELNKKAQGTDSLIEQLKALESTQKKNESLLEELDEKLLLHGEECQGVLHASTAGQAVVNQLIHLNERTGLPPLLRMTSLKVDTTATSK